MNHVPGLLAFLGLIFTLIGCHAWMTEESTNAGLPLVHAAAPIETQDSRLYAICPTILPWQAPKYVKEHRV